MIRRIFPIVVAAVFLLGLIFLFISLLLQRSQSESKNSSHILGSEDARVHIIGYFDLESSQSREAWEKVVYLRDQYGDRVSFEFRHYPITAIHRHAMNASQALEAAEEQEKFWEFLDKLWEQQDAWHSVSDPVPLFTQYAEQSGVPDIPRFQEEVDRQRFSDRILRHLQQANDVGASLEQPFFINDQPVSASGVQLAVERILSKPEKQD